MAQNEIVSATDLSKIESAHPDMWVALSRDHAQVLGSAKSLAELIKQVPDSETVYHRVLPRGVTFAPLT